MADAARRVGVGERTVHSRVADGRLRSFKVGARRLVPVAALMEFIDAGGDGR